MGYVFISYSSKNRDIADAFKNLLNKNNIDTWMAPHDIPVGSKYASVIGKSIKNCSCFLLLLTHDSQGSIWVAKEVERAINYKKIIVPVQLEDVILNDEFEMYLSTDQILAIKTIDDSTNEMQELIVTLKLHTKTQNVQEVKALETSNLTSMNQVSNSTQKNTQETMPEKKNKPIDNDTYKLSRFGFKLRWSVWVILGIFASAIIISFLVPWGIGQWIFGISVGTFILLLFWFFSYLEETLIICNIASLVLLIVNFVLRCWLKDNYICVAFILSVEFAISSFIVMVNSYRNAEIKQGHFAMLFTLLNVGMIFMDKIWGYIAQLFSQF